MFLFQAVSLLGIGRWRSMHSGILRAYVRCFYGDKVSAVTSSRTVRKGLYRDPFWTVLYTILELVLALVASLCIVW